MFVCPSVLAAYTKLHSINISTKTYNKIMQGCKKNGIKQYSLEVLSVLWWMPSRKWTRRWAYYCQLLIHSCANHTELYTVELRGEKRMSCQGERKRSWPNFKVLSQNLPERLKTSARIACLRAEIWIRDLPNMKHERLPLNHDVRLNLLELPGKYRVLRWRKKTNTKTKHKINVTTFTPLSLNHLKARLNHKNSVRTSKRTPHFTITNINYLMLFTEIIAVYIKNWTIPINAK
jgi:hypothetical protein